LEVFAMQQIVPETGFLRIWQITGDPKRGAAPIFPISRSAWWAGVASGKYPKGVLLGTRTRVWTAESIRNLIATTSAVDFA
jgi:prophage regulatory protein